MIYFRKIFMLLWIALALFINGNVFALPDPHALPGGCSRVDAWALCRNHVDSSTQYYVPWGNSGSCNSTSTYRAQVYYSSCDSNTIYCWNWAYAHAWLPPSATPCSYISSRSEVRTVCKNLSDWNGAWSATCEQDVTWSANYSNGTTPPWCPWNAAKPGDYTDTITISLNYKSTTCNSDNFADNSDSCNIIFGVDGIPNEWIEWLEWQSTSNEVFANNNIYRNQVNKNDVGGALTIPSVNMKKNSKTNYSLEFDSLTSIVPFEETGSFEFNLDGDSISKSWITMWFKKPFSGSLYISGDVLKVGTEQTLVLDVAELSILTSRNISNYKESLEAVDSDYEVHDINGENDLTVDPSLNMTLNYVGWWQVWKSAVQTNPYIDYTIWGKWVKYYLSTTSDPTDNNPIVSDEGSFYGVKILGLYQGQGKLYTSGQNENNSDISTIEYRNAIKKNIWILTRDMNGSESENGQIKNGVWYIEWWNHSLYQLYQDNGNSFANVSTIIVHNGNITIDANINKGSRVLGIMSTRDDYNDESIWNIFITPNVSYISAAIFADGGFISLWWWNNINSVGNGTYEDTTTRTSTLEKQLVLEWVLISRNTVWWALKWETWDYILPGGAITSNFDKAVMYDLDYIRRGVNPTNSNNRGYNLNPFVVLYDSRIQTNPPLGFRED